MPGARIKVFKIMIMIIQVQFIYRIYIPLLLQLCSKLFNPPCDFPMIFIVNKSCNIECCVNNMFRINKKMIVS